MNQSARSDDIDSFRTRLLHVVLSVAAAVLVAVPSPARGDEVTTLNASYQSISTSLRSDLVLLPKLAKLEAAPKAVATVRDAALIGVGVSGWDDASAWAQRQPQKDALAALRQVTQERDWRRSYAFGQPYGINGVPVELIQAKLYTELGDPPTLGAAQFFYLPALDAMQSLVYVEATRLTADGKVAEAADVLVDFIFFARQMVDRLFAREVRWGYAAMAGGFERLRDVVYSDIRSGKPSITEAKVLEVLARLDETQTGKDFVDLGRAKFPIGDKAAAAQMAAMIYSGDGSVNQRTFATTLSKLGSTERPLRLFAEAGRWQSQAGTQLSRRDFDARLTGVFDDWSRLWTLDFFDPSLDRPTAYVKETRRDSIAALYAVVPDLGDLYEIRQVVRVEAGGTRTALGVVGAWLARREWPPVVRAIRPRFMAEVDADAFNPNRRDGAKPPMEYFIPNRTGGAEGAKPHTMTLVPPEGGQGFDVSLREDVFVLYSVGRDGARHNAKRIQNTPKLAQESDYLIWPPYTALKRQYLMDQGTLK